MPERPTAQRMIELGRRHIDGQRARIERQRTLVERLERDGHAEDALRNAREHLGEMLKMLDGMLSTQRAGWA
jgi:hypothetical protein